MTRARLVRPPHARDRRVDVSAARPRKRTLFFIGNVIPDLVRVLILANSILRSDTYYYFVALPINTATHSILACWRSRSSCPSSSRRHSRQASRAVTCTRPSPRGPGSWPALPAGGTARRGARSSCSSSGCDPPVLDTFMYPYGAVSCGSTPSTMPGSSGRSAPWCPSSFDGILWLSPFFVAAVVAEILVRVKRKGRQGP